MSKSRNARKRRRKKPADPRFSSITPKAGPVKVTKSDGTVEIQKAKRPTEYREKPYAKPRPKKAF